MILYPNAKINIGLNILSKREDGFHELETLMYPIGLTDILTINRSENKYQSINFTTTGITIDGKPEDNLIVKAYNLIAQNYKLPVLDIHLHKSIPFGAGLGGGSADCAFAIKSINEYCKLNISTAKMENIASKLGSDCPFFINNKPAIAKGRGEILSSFKININQFHFVIIIPPIPISTKQAYSLVTPCNTNKNLESLLQKDTTGWKNYIKNDFEESVFPQYPEIEKIKNTLYSMGAVYSSLSGSGSAVFGIFKNRPVLKDVFTKEYFIWQD